MLYTEKEKHEIERVKEVFTEHLRQSPDFELLWSDKVGYVWLTIGVNPVYVDTGIRIESAADLCCKCLDDVAMDVLYMTGNDHALEEADSLELAEIKRRWGAIYQPAARLCVSLQRPVERKNVIYQTRCQEPYGASGTFFVNLIKKSLTICLWKNSQEHFIERRCPAFRFHPASDHPHHFAGRYGAGPHGGAQAGRVRHHPRQRRHL